MRIIWRKSNMAPFSVFECDLNTTFSASADNVMVPVFSVLLVNHEPV